MVPSLTAVDRRGRPQAPGLLYGDGRGRGNRAVDSSPGEPGSLSTSDVLPDSEGFLRWAVAEAPGAYGYWPAQAVANFALSGVAAIDSGVAMMSASLLSAGQWDVAKLGKIGVNAAQMPLIVNMGARAGTVTGTDAALAGGTVDAMCDQIVSGADNEGDVLVICGATLIVWAVVEEWVDIPGLWTVPHTVAGKVLVGGPSNAGALFVDWARSLLHGRVGCPPGDGPTGRTPGRHAGPGARGRATPTASRCGPPISGENGSPTTTPPCGRPWWAWTSPTTPTPSSGPPTSRPDSWCATCSTSVRSRPAASWPAGEDPGSCPGCKPWPTPRVSPSMWSSVHEGSALGAAFLARMAAGLETSLDDARRWARVGYRVEPDATWQDAADKRYDRYRALGPD